ncbi:MAG: hypothetical protein P1V35_11990, partial [Planctomycetota bacterium]|nr:hypothetical protein [Planctomycetota bacterium]
VRYTVQLEGTAPGGVGEALYNVSPGGIFIQVGSGSAVPDFSGSIAFLLANDGNFPGVGTMDYYAGGVYFGDGIDASVFVQDLNSLMFSSNDLSLIQGTYPGTADDYITIRQGFAGSGVDVSVDQMVIAELGDVGTSQCIPLTQNSTGMHGVLGAWGSDVRDAYNLRMDGASLPPNSIALLLTSQTFGITPNPGGSQGTLCLGGAIGRFRQEVQPTGPTGTFSIPLDWQAIPSPTGPIVAMAGQTFHFQAYYRDLNPGQTTNLTNSLEILLQ